MFFTKIVFKDQQLRRLVGKIWKQKFRILQRIMVTWKLLEVHINLSKIINVFSFHISKVLKCHFNC